MDEEWLSSILAPFELNSPDIIDYLLPIIQDGDEDLDTIIESCKDFLEASMVGKQINQENTQFILI